jgi:5-methylcytosine-specific restriction protein A
MSRPPRLCTCGRIVAYGVRCACQQEAHRERSARHDRRRPNARQRGYTAEWEAAAKAFLQLPGNERCECGAPAVLVRHVISIRRAPHLRMVRSNWRPGCRRCNALDTIRERNL